jgi:hypothetical protein
MHGGGRRILVAASLALVALGATASLARADDSQIRISEVYSDASLASHTDFLELQLLADGQSIPGTGTPAGAAIRLCNANCSSQLDVLLPPISLPAATSQRTLLIGWNDDPKVDVGATPFNVLPAAGGACFYQSLSPAVPIDCVSWGNFSGPLPSVGSPAPAMNGSQSLTRTEARGCPTLMEAIDDSDNSAADFSLATPSPRSNLATPTETPCPTPAPAPTKKKCKKKKRRHAGAQVAKKKKCKKKKR